MDGNNMKLTLIDNITGKTKLYTKTGRRLKKILKEEHCQLPSEARKLRIEFETIKHELNDFFSMDISMQKAKLKRYHELFVELNKYTTL